MSSNYAKYLKERENLNIIEDSNGFAVYELGEDYVYIQDIYVVENKRKSKIASNYADQIAKIASSQGIKIMLGSVCLTTKGVTSSIKVLLAYGMEFSSAKENMLYFKKTI